MIEFLLNGELVTEDHLDPNITLLNYLRYRKTLTGTKEGCGSGDCGACTILLGEWSQHGWHYKAINSCLALLASVHGRQVITVEALAKDEALHPVQQGMVDCHGSQCGFCTPGFVMSLTGLHLKNQTPSRHDVLEAISGNLCRCTGYAPILKAAFQAAREEVYGLGQLDYWQPEMTDIPSISAPEGQVFVPQTEAQLSSLLAEFPSAHIVAGGTDINLAITQHYQRFATIIITAQITDLCEISLHKDGSISIGAAVTYERSATAIKSMYPEATELLSRIGSLQIREAATLAGNVANASPIGDGPPLLIALNASIEYVTNGERLVLPVSEFITGYKTTVLAEGDYIRSIIIPPRPAESKYYIAKVSKRYEDDISTVMLAASCKIESGSVADIQFVFGGMAATPARAKSVEAALMNTLLAQADIESLAQYVVNDFEPIDDVRASAAYRLQIAQSLVTKALLSFNDEAEAISIWSAAG